MSAGAAILGAAGSMAAAWALCWSSWRLSGWLCGGGGLSALRAATAAYAGIVQVAVVLELLGTLTLLNGPAFLASQLLVAALVRWRVRPAAKPEAGVPPASDRRGWAIIAAIAVPFAALQVTLSLTSPASDFDTLRYHLVNAGFWLDGHSILQLPTGFPSDAAAPGLGELFGDLLMLPTHSTELAFLLPTLFTAVTAVALVAISEQLGYARWRGGLAALLFVLTPLCYLGEADSLVTDMVVVAGVAGAALFGLRAAAGRRWVVLAGGCLGLACAGKGTGLLVGALVVVWVSLFPGRRHPLQVASTVAATAAVVAGVWYLRNWVELGSPVFPYGLTIAGHVVWTSAPDPLTPGNISLLAAMMERHWAAVRQAGAYFLVLFGPGVAIALAAAPVALVWAVRRRLAALSQLIALGLILAAGYLVTPYTGAVVHQNLGTATRFALWWADLLLLGVVLVLPRRPLLLLGLAGVLYGADLAVRPSFHPALIVTPPVALLTAALTAALVVAWLAGIWWGRHRRRLPSPRWLMLAAVPVLAALLLALQRPSSTAVTAALDRLGEPTGLVVVIHDADLADVEGPSFSVRIRYAAGGSAGDLRAFTTAAQLDGFVASVHPALVVVGDDGIEALPAGWKPPATWTYVGPFERGSRIFDP